MNINKSNSLVTRGRDEHDDAGEVERDDAVNTSGDDSVHATDEGDGDAYERVGAGPDDPRDIGEGGVDPAQVLLGAGRWEIMMTKQTEFCPGGGEGITKSRGNQAFILVAICSFLWPRGPKKII